MLIVLYCFLTDLRSMDFEITSINFTLLLDIYILPILILHLYNLLKIKKDLIFFILCAANVACVFSLFSFAIPEIGSFFREDLLKSNDFTSFVAFRTFGLAEDLTFSYGITQGLMIGMMALYSKSRLLLWFAIPIFLGTILINARTGFVPVIIFTILFFSVNFRPKLIVQIFAVAFCLVMLLPNLNIESEKFKTLEWGLDFFLQMNDVTTGSSTSDFNTFDVLAGSMFVLPSSFLEFIFGTGNYIFGKDYGPSSDVGYILQLYYGGLIYLFLVFFILIWMIVTFFKTVRVTKKENIFWICLFLTICIVNIKGNVFTTNGFLRLAILLVMHNYIINSNKKIQSIVIK